MAAVAEREEARGGRAEIDDDEKERRHHVEPKIGAEPWHAERQRRRHGSGCLPDQHGRRSAASHERYDEARAIDDKRRCRRPPDDESEHRNRQQGSDTTEREREGHRYPALALRRTPRPPPVLAPPSPSSSMPAASSACTSFISESTLPRIVSSLLSM